MKYEPSVLEEWMRSYYFAASTDIGSSGVEDLSFAELRQITGVTIGDLDSLVLRDSPSFGMDPLRSAIADRWSHGDPSWVIATHGASEAIYLVMSALLEPGDELISLDPAYHSHTSIGREIGCRIVPWKLRAESNFKPDFAELRELVTERTKVIAVNFPHNPTGTTITRAEQLELVEIASSVGAHLVWDAAFSELTYDEAPLPDPTRLYDKAISIGTFSKSFGLPGLRFGWCIADPEVLDRMIHLRDRMTLHLSPLVEFLALRAVEHIDAIVEQRFSQASKNLATLLDWAELHRDKVELTRPGGGVTVFPAILSVPDVYEFCTRLVEERGVLLVPGHAFGHTNRVRLGFGGPAAVLERGLSVLGDELGKTA